MAIGESECGGMAAIDSSRLTHSQLFHVGSKAVMMRLMTMYDFMMGMIETKWKA